MSESVDDNSSVNPATMRGVRYARIAGRMMALLLLVLGVASILKGGGGFELFKGTYFVVYGVVLLLPFNRMPEASWRWSYGLLVGLSVCFVFVMIAVVMFAYMAAADRGERLGVPGFEGTLIFFSLMQVPVVLFQRKPDLLD